MSEQDNQKIQTHGAKDEFSSEQDSAFDNDVEETNNDVELEDAGETIENVEPKKKGMNPKILAAGLGILTLSLVGFFGFNFYQKMSKAKAAKAQTSMPAPAFEQSPSAPLLTASAAPASASTDDAIAGAQTPVATASVGSAGAVTVATTSGPSAQTPAPYQGSVMESPAVKPPTASSQQDLARADLSENLKVKSAELEGRVSTLESNVKSLSDAMKSTKKPLSVEPQSQAQSASGISVVKAQTVKKKKIKKDKLETTPDQTKKEPEVSVVLPMQLKGVYPPRGEDRQAWILNPKTNAITVVSKGTEFDGMKVLKIESDFIQTTKGLIR